HAEDPAPGGQGGGTPRAGAGVRAASDAAASRGERTAGRRADDGGGRRGCYQARSAGDARQRVGQVRGVRIRGAAPRGARERERSSVRANRRSGALVDRQQSRAAVAASQVSRLCGTRRVGYPEPGRVQFPRACPAGTLRIFVVDGRRVELTRVPHSSPLAPLPVGEGQGVRGARRGVRGEGGIDYGSKGGTQSLPRMTRTSESRCEVGLCRMLPESTFMCSASQSTVDGLSPKSTSTV